MKDELVQIGFEDGAGISSAAEFDELNKALEVGYTASPSSGGNALRVESLEGTLVSTTFDAKHCVLWQMINKVPAYSTVEEYNQLTDYGADGYGFVPAGEKPEEDDSTFARQKDFVKYLGTTRSVQHQATLVRTVLNDAIATENISGTMKILRDVENSLFWGNRALKYNYPTLEGLEFNGLNQMIDSSNYLDMAGLDLSEGAFEDAAEIVADGYGDPTHMFIGLKAAKEFSKSMLPKGRVMYPADSGGIAAGAVVKEVVTTSGTVQLAPSKFLNLGRSAKVTCPSAASSTKAPTAPASITPGSMTGSTGKFHAAQQGATYFKATACNRYGESVPTAASSLLTITSSDLAKYVPLTIANAASVVTAPEWYNIYCTEASGTTYYLIAQVAASSQANNGTTVHNYNGLIMANTGTAFIGDMSPDILLVKQLAPLMKMDLARTKPTFDWMILLYIVPQLKASKKWARVLNIK
ncbi:conserved hypothetical protein [Gammaproteobacteria bacterium]